MKKWHREPLFHFLVIGALIFVMFSMAGKEEGTVQGNRIVVTAADMERLSDNWTRKWNRPPTAGELRGLVEAYIREEVYYREALALGLDRDDTIIRRRMMQKMEFLTNDLAELNTPDDAALERYFLDNQDRYELPARLTFTHIYFSTDKHGEKAREDARRVLSELDRVSNTVMRVPERGDSLMLPSDFTRETPFEVARTFGRSFADQLFRTETGIWQGPIESGYGLHLVRIHDRTEPVMPEFASVIDEVREDWMFEQRQRTNKEAYEMFKERYQIVVEEMPKQSGVARAPRAGREAS
jgi:hypothetical protein